MVDGETCGLSEYTISVVQLVIDNSIKTNSGNDTLNFILSENFLTHKRLLMCSSSFKQSFLNNVKCTRS